MGISACVLTLVWATSVPAAPLPPEPQYVNSHAIILSFQAANAVPVDRARVWIRADDDQTWSEASVARTTPGAVRFDAANDGKYCFYMVLENEGGRSADPPKPDSNPHLKLVVDTTPPTLQIHAALAVGVPGGKPTIRLEATLVDEHLGQAGTRLFYRTDQDTAWQDGGPVTFSSGAIIWQPPADISQTADLCIAAIDLAGNEARDEIRDVDMSCVVGGRPGSPPDTDMPGPVTAPESPANDQLVPPVSPVILQPIAPPTLAEQPSTAPSTVPAEAARRSRRLRQQAAEYLAQGRFTLAGARLQDALELDPSDPDLQVDLGSVLYRTRQYDAAARRFHLALDASPDHVGAIEGLALVAATQHRYPEAHSHLQRLLTLRPESANHWLHYGDIEHMLGNTADALDAWEKALKLGQVDKAVRDKAQKRLKLFGQEPAPVTQ